MESDSRRRRRFPWDTGGIERSIRDLVTEWAQGEVVVTVALFEDGAWREVLRADGTLDGPGLGDDPDDGLEFMVGHQKLPGHGDVVIRGSVVSFTVHGGTDDASAPEDLYPEYADLPVRALPTATVTDGCAVIDTTLVDETRVRCTIQKQSGTTGMTINVLPAASVEAAADLLREAELTRPWNDAIDDLRRALGGPASTVLAGTEDGSLVATAMVGHDGHNGWVYYLAVRKDAQGRGLGRTMMLACENWLAEHDVPELHVLLHGDNVATRGFYEYLGYAPHDGQVVALSRRLAPAVNWKATGRAQPATDSRRVAGLAVGLGAHPFCTQARENAVGLSTGICCHVMGVSK